MNLAAAFQQVNALLGGGRVIAVEIRGPLFEFREIFDRSSLPVSIQTIAECSRRAATARQFAMRNSCGRMSPTKMGRRIGMAVDVTVEASDTAARSLGAAVRRLVELLLRETA